MSVPGKQQKRCWQKWPNTNDGKKPPDAPVLPYRLPELIAAVGRGETIYVVEGEPKVEVLRSWGLAATCSAEGAGKWMPEHAAYLRGANVVIMPDNDEPGRRHAGPRRALATGRRCISAAARAAGAAGAR